MLSLVRCPYSRTKIYVARMSRDSSIDRYYLLPVPDLSSKPADRRCCCRSTGQTDGRTLDRLMTLTAYRILCGPRKKTQNPIRTNATNGGRRVVKAAAATCHLVCSRATHLCQEGRTSMELDASGWLVAPSDICLQYLAVRPRSARSLHSGCAI